MPFVILRRCYKCIALLFKKLVFIREYKEYKAFIMAGDTFSHLDGQSAAYIVLLLAAALGTLSTFFWHSYIHVNDHRKFTKVPTMCSIAFMFNLVVLSAFSTVVNLYVCKRSSIQTGLTYFIFKMLYTGLLLH